MSRLHRRVALAGSAVSAQLAQWTQRGFVKSIQTGTIDLNGVTSKDAVLSPPVVPENSILVYLGATLNAFSASPQLYSRLTFTSGAAVTATSSIAPSGVALLVSYAVIEFMPGVIRSVQRGTIVINSVTSATATIAAVTLAKAWPVWLGFNYNSAGNNDLQFMPKVVLTNPTTVTGSIGTATTGFNVTVGYQIVEFY